MHRRCILALGGEKFLADINLLKKRQTDWRFNTLKKMKGDQSFCFGVARKKSSC